MKNSFTILLGILLSYAAWTQTQTQIPVYLSQTITNANSRGFYSSLPKDYTTAGKSYPLIIWVTGAGGIGQGTPADLPRVLEFGLPKVISQGIFPDNFRVNGVDNSFIVISPQFMGWPSATNIDAMITYISNNYRVDPERIYLMGLSAGGGGIWDYAGASVLNADRIAAMIPFCGTSSPTQNSASRIASSKLPVWAFHNTHDGTVPVAYSRNWVNYINNYLPAPNPAARLTEFPVQSNDPIVAHDCSAVAALPNYKPEGINIYEWLLKYKKRTVAANAAPVARAGNNESIMLPTNTVTLNGASSTDADGSIVSYNWRQVSGTAASIASPSSIQTTVTFTRADTYRFELTVTDNSGNSAKSSVDITVLEAQSVNAKTFKVNIYGGTNPYNNVQWNNWNVTGSLTSARFNYDDGTASNVTAALTASAEIKDNGATYATTATVCPPQVLRYSSANTSTRTLTFSGMTNTKTYDLEFYGSRATSASSGNSSIFQIGNSYETISTDNNLNDIARFTNIVPDASGRITVTINRTGTWTYLSGFVVKENTAGSSLITSASRSVTEVAALAEKPVTESVALAVYPNPAKDIVYLTIPTGVSGSYKVSVVNMNGQIVLQKAGTKGDAGYMDKIDIGNLQKGMYLVKVSVQNKNFSSTIIKL